MAEENRLAEAVAANEQFGDLPVIQSATRTNKVYTEVSAINEGLANEMVLVRARMQSSRVKGNKLAFLVLRQQSFSIQAVLCAEGDVPKEMVKFAKGISRESVIDLYAKVTPVPSPITSCTQSKVELQVSKLFVVSRAIPQLPLQVEDCARPEEEVEAANLKEGETIAPRVNQDTRLDNRWIDLRTPANQAVFRVQSAICQLFREFLLDREFVEIHTPKMIGAASEGGANIFEVKYFDRKAYLAQSPQLYKQMAIVSDLNRVFEIGPVFRAEQSFTHRHLTEFVGLDLEMAFKEHYHEVLETIGQMFCFMFDNLKSRFGKVLEAVNAQYPFEPIVYSNPPLILTFTEGVRLLNEAGIKQDPLADMGTPEEKELGKIVKKIYGVDFYIMDKFPLAARAFYSMPDPSDNRYANAFDIYLRGEEIVSGAQRIHDPDLLLKCIKDRKIDAAPLKSYIDSFKAGSPPHAGMGAGLERVTMLYLGLHNIRRTSMFPRDPRRVMP